ncbi:MAG TPA: hypothetical protein PLP66_04230 [Phycisphaerae bacterium]|nr:hypothetical protein [Phycisphaerae bacterium]
MSWTHVRRRFAGGSALTALSYLIVFASLMGCERSDGPPSGDARALRGALVAVIGPAEGHPQWPGIRGGAERFAAGNPSLRLLCTAPREEWGETLATAVERVLSDRPAIVCLWITDPEAAAPSVARIANQQVVLVTMNARATAGYPAAHVDLDWSSAAHLLGSQLGVVAAGSTGPRLSASSIADNAASAASLDLGWVAMERLSYSRRKKRHTDSARLRNR